MREVPGENDCRDENVSWCTRFRSCEAVMETCLHRYYVEGYTDPRNFFGFKGYPTDELQLIAENAGQHFHETHGPENIWPLEIVLLDEKLQEVDRFLVEREAVPVFSATKIHKK